MTATAQVTVDPDLCIGSAECVRILPDAFEIDEKRGVSVPQPAAGSAAPELLAEAVRSCPTGALHVLDANRGAL
jgi:ferredoxin